MTACHNKRQQIGQPQIDLHELLTSAVDVVRSLAVASSVTVGLAVPEGSRVLVTNPPLARQVIDQPPQPGYPERRRHRGDLTHG